MENIATAAAQLADFDYHVDRVASEIAEQMPEAQDGTVIGGSYDKSTGTVEILWGDTYSIIPDDPPPGDTFINHQKLAQFVPFPGFQYGPTGVERVVAIPEPTGFGVLYKHFSDDSPQAPAGEVWMFHKTVATQTQPNAAYDSGSKLTNDGTNAGDGKGGAHWGHQADWTQVSTATGHKLTQSDTNKQVILQSSGGHTLTYNDPGNVPGHDQGVTLQTIGNMLDSFDDTTKTILRQPVANLFSQWNGTATTITHQVTNAVGTVISGASGAQFIQSTVTNGIFSLISGGTGTQYIQHQCTSGLQTLIDATGTISGAANSINHVGSKVALGDLVKNLSSNNNIARFTDMNDAMTNQITQMIGNGIIQLLYSIVANGGLPTGASATSLIAALSSGGFSSATFFSLPTSLHNITVPACSATVLAK